MPPLQFVPESVPLLCQLLMAGYGAVYVATIRRKTRATRWLLAALVGLTLYAAAYFLSTTPPYESLWPARFTALLYLSMLGAILALIGFAYTFHARPFRREGRAVVAAAVLGWAALAVWVGVSITGGAPTPYGPMFEAFGLALPVGTAWALVVFVRQARRFRRLACASPCRCGRRHAFARAHGTFAALAALLLVLAVVNALATRDLVPFRVFQYVILGGSLAFMFGLFVAFLNHAPERTTVQAKLAGLGLATVLLMLGAAGLQLLVPHELAEEAGNELRPAEALRFEPQPDGGYRVESAPAPLHDTSGVALRPRGSAVRLPFAFPFAGAAYRTAYLSPCTIAAFAPFDVAGLPETRLPRIAAFLRPCYGGSPARRRVDVVGEAVVFTWFNDEIDGGRGASQLALFPDGAFEVRYAGPRQAPIGGAVGFSPGGDAPEVDFDPADPHGAAVPAAAGLWRDYTDRYRAVAHARTAPLVEVVVAATLFVLLLFPVFLRAGLLRPLAALTAGVRRLDAGDLTARVPSRANDELDELARSFNGMAASVRAAQRELRAYAGTLEARVAARTAELEEQRHALERSLDDLRATQAQLVQAEKLASLGRLTAGVAHEIKNPLNFVNNFAGLQVELADELAAVLGPDRAEAAELLADLRLNAAKIREHGARADGIVRAMQLHARADAVDRHEVDLAPLLTLAVDAAERGYRARYPGADVPPVARVFEAALGRAVVAPEALAQVVINLLDNALDAVRRAGGASSGDGAPSAGPAVVLRARRLDGLVEICVEDRGPGMDEATRARVFEPFFTTKPPGQGTGLGLSIAYDIVTDGHGGAIAVESEPGRGCLFTVTLPG